VTIYVKDTRTGYQKVLVDAASAIAAHEAAPDPHPQYAVDGHTHAQLHDAVTVSDTDTLDLTLAGQAVSGAVKKQMSIDSDASGLKLVNDSTTPGNTKLYGTNGSGVKGWYDQPVGGAGGSREIKITIDGDGAVITTGVKPSYFTVATAGTISAWYISGTPSGSIVVDIIKAAGAIPVAGDSMTGGTDRPSLTSATVNSDTNITGWTTRTLTAGDVLGVNIISASTVTNVVITLKVD
jgi:hypothetical protein